VAATVRGGYHGVVMAAVLPQLLSICAQQLPMVLSTVRGNQFFGFLIRRGGLEWCLFINFLRILSLLVTL